MSTTHWPQRVPQSKRVSSRAAVEAYIRAVESLEGLKGDNDDQTTGIQIVKRAIEEPLRQIVTNAGGEGSVVVNKVKEGKGAFGYNARDDRYEDLLAAGIIDPTKVSRVALRTPLRSPRCSSLRSAFWPRRRRRILRPQCPTLAWAA